MGDHEGNVVHLYEHECSMRRRARDEAISRARRKYRLEDIRTTMPRHLRLLEEDDFRPGETTGATSRSR